MRINKFSGVSIVFLVIFLTSSLFLVACVKNVEEPSVEPVTPPASEEPSVESDTPPVSEEPSLSEKIAGEWEYVWEQDGSTFIYLLTLNSDNTVMLKCGWYQSELFSIFSGTFTPEGETAVLNGTWRYPGMEGDVKEPEKIQGVILSLVPDGNTLYISEVSDFEFLYTEKEGGLPFTRTGGSSSGGAGSNTNETLLNKFPQNEGDLYMETPIHGVAIANPYLNIRSMPSTKSDAIGSLIPGELVEIWGTNNRMGTGEGELNWYIALFDNGTGGLLKGYISANPKHVEIIG